MADKACNVFISHVHEDDHRLGPLKDLLASKGCVARDYSINSDRPNRAKSPDYIKDELLKPRIDSCGTLVVLVSPETKDSEWVNWEVEYAHEQGKRVIGVWDHDQSGCELPEKLEELGDKMVSWSAQKVIDAIFDEDDDEWEDPQGSPMPSRPPRTHPC